MNRCADEPIVQLRTVGLGLTLKCNFRCDHCITGAGPEHGDEMSEPDAFALIEGIAEHSDNICFTGGECMLRRKLLLACIRQSVAAGMVPTLVTNGYWATSDARARKTLEELSRAGLKGICISMDRFHLPFTTRKNAQRVASLSRDYGIAAVIRVCSIVDDPFAEEYVKEKPEDFNYQVVNVVRLGRANGLPASYFRQKKSFPPGGCTTILSPIILPDGSVQACCGPGIDFHGANPLNVGNWRKEEIRTILLRHRMDPLIMAVCNLGPKYLTELLKQHGALDKLENRDFYTGRCELCVDLLNNPEVVDVLRKQLDDPKLRMRLTAGQVFLQSELFTRENALPEFA